MTLGAAVAPKPEQCARKRELTNDLRSVVDRLVELSVSERKAALIRDVGQAKVIAGELEKLRQRELALLSQYREHVQMHGCR